MDQTQTQLEHARIGELEKNLLLEKAQAERLLRELADNRVTAATSCHQRLRLLMPPSASLFLLFSLSLAALLTFFFFPFAPLLGRFRNVLLCSVAM